MNEKVLNIVCIVLIVYLAIVLWGSVRCIESRDYALREARTELQNTRERLQSANERVEQLEAGLISVADRLGELNSIFAENRNGLHESIERLRAIAKEVEALEDRLRDLNGSDGSDRSSVDILAE